MYIDPKIFKDQGLNVMAESNLQVTYYLDVTFNLKTGKYYPYRKKNKLLYMHNLSTYHLSSNKPIYDQIIFSSSPITRYLTKITLKSVIDAKYGQ